MEHNNKCRLFTKKWAIATADAEHRLDNYSEVEYGERMATPSKACNKTDDVHDIIQELQKINIKTPGKLRSFSKSLSSSSSAKFSSPDFPNSTLADHNITFLEGASISELAQNGFADFPFIIFEKELPLERASLSKLQRSVIDQELPVHDYKVIWLEKGDKHVLTKNGANWEIEDEITEERSVLFQPFLKKFGKKSQTGRRSEDAVGAPIRDLCGDLFFVSTGNNHHMQNSLYQGPLTCEHLKPDFVAGPFDIIEEKVVSALGLESLLETADLLSSFDVVPGTTVHPLPFIVGELKKENKPYCAEDGYKVMVEMLIVRLALDALFEKPPAYTFGILEAHHEWRIFAMVKNGAGYTVAEIFFANDARMLDRVYIATVLLRLATFFVWQLQCLKLVSKEQQEALKELFKQKQTPRTTRASHEKETNDIDDGSDADDEDDINDGDDGDPSKRRKSEEKSEKGQTNNLSDVRQLNGNVFLAKCQGEDCIIKVGEIRKIRREYTRYRELRDSQYIAELRAAHQLSATRAFLVLKPYKPLPVFKSKADLLRITKQLLSVLAVLHERRLVHGDIKNGNIVWDEATNSIKLIDFETCVQLPSGAFFKTHHGTELFKAPELLEGRWCSEKVDIYSAGLVCAAMVYGGQIHTTHAREAILKGVFSSQVPPEFAAVIPLLKGMLAAAPEDRISADEALTMLNTLENEQVATGVLPSSVPVRDDKENQHEAKPKKPLAQPQRAPLEGIINLSRVHK